MADRKEELFTKAKLQATMFQNKSTLKKYSKIHARQVSIREVSSVVLSSKLNASEKLTKLTLKDKKLVAEFNLLSQATINTIKKKLKSKKIVFNLDKKKNNFIFEMTL